MVSVGALILGVLSVSAGVDAFLPFLANVYIDAQGRSRSAAGARSSSRASRQAMCSWFNMPAYASAIASQNVANSGIVGGEDALQALMNRLYLMTMATGSTQVGSPGGVVVQVEETNPRAFGASVNAAANRPATASELDYYDSDASYYYEEDEYAYGADYAYSDPFGFADTVYYDYGQVPRNPAQVGSLWQTLYGAGIRGATGVGSDSCSQCAASLLSMLMG